MRNIQEASERPASGRDRLAHAAQKLFRSESYGAVSISCILEECGLKAPALYHHFGDKEGIY
ncbi:MAG: TetR/AcrR family transcriptional regulator, partial [Fimbriimonadaceae bacterium]